MEVEDSYKKQYSQAGYSSSQDFGQVSRDGAGSDVSDRQPQMSSIKSPTSGPWTSPGGQSQGITDSRYPQGQQQHSPQYQPDFFQDPQRAQQYNQYPSNMMYSIPQQAPQRSPYEPAQQFQPCQSAAVELFSNQYDVPQYYALDNPTSAPSSMTAQYASVPFQQEIVHQQPGHTGRAALSTAYTARITQLVQPTQDTAYCRYIEKLLTIFQDVKDGKLVEAGQCLLEISEFLLGQAVELGTRTYLNCALIDANMCLGLTEDKEELQDERIKLWNNFNTCWLAVLQKQKDTTQEMIDRGQPPVPPQSYLQKNSLERMGRELIRLCDGSETHGLVDYQMGVWEEEIISGRSIIVSLRMRHALTAQ